MDNTVGDEYVRRGDHGGIDINIAVDDADGDTFALEGFESHVHEHRAVANSARDYVVAENVCDHLGGGVVKGGTDGLECFVARSEDGDIGRRVDSLNKFGIGECADKGGQVGGDGSKGSVGGDRQEAVNHMYDTVVIGNIL